MALVLSGCRSTHLKTQNNHLLDWKYSDLRVLDPIDSPNPDQDLIAIYARTTSSSFQVRLDFLDLEEYLGKDIYILVDTNPGGSSQISTDAPGSMKADIQWDYLLEITDSGIIQLVNSHNLILEDSQIFVVYDSAQDQIVVDFLSPVLPIYPGKTKLQVIITTQGTMDISDISTIFNVDEPPPPRAQVVLAFWNTFAAVSPAQTLRSWAGAHTGPLSSRHGLSYLLEQADRTNIPVSLYDLWSPENMSGLDYLGQLGYLDGLINHGVLNLYKNSKHNNVEAQISLLMKVNKSLMFGSSGYAQSIKINQCNLLAGITNQNQAGGLSTSCKALLITHAINTPGSPLYLGGDFSNSVMGDSTDSVEIFGYFATHPWLQVVASDAIFSDAGITPNRIANIQNVAAISDNGLNIIAADNLAKLSPSTITLYASLLQAPDNKITGLAWQVFNSLIQASSEDFSILRSNYIDQIGELVAAATWAEAPTTTQSCNLDLDHDGSDECILSNDQMFLVIEPDGGYIPFMFYKDPLGIHQIIGPTWQFIVGLSDPMVWDTSQGVRGDPAQILGALQDSFTNWNIYNPDVTQNTVTLSNNDGSIRKSIAIAGNSVHFNYISTTGPTANIIIPLVLDPWYRFTPNWGNGYLGSHTENKFSWGIKDGETAIVKSNHQMQQYSFIDSRSMMNKPEDPNYDYPRGHYLPFPMAWVEMPGSENLSVEVTINP